MNIRPFLLALLLLLLLLPGLNMRLEFYKSEPLKGDLHLAPNAWLNKKGWLDGSYQEQKDKYFNDNVGFRPDLVRTNNEIDYLFFGKLHAAGVVLGKDGYLYEQGYIDARNGKDFAGYGELRQMMHQLRYVQDTLARAGVKLLFAFTPSKGRYYSDHFPDVDRPEPNTSTNYGEMKRLCDSFRIEHIDMNGWFLNQRGKAQHPLFSKQGIHWTRWAAIRAADTMNHHLERLLGIDIPDIRLGKDTCSPTSLKGDDDIAQGLNLWHPITKELWCYSDISYEEGNPKTTKPAIIFITDSFFWTWAYEQEPQNCYNNWAFWYYFNEMYTDSVFKNQKPMEHISDNTWVPQLLRSDALVIMMTEPNLVPTGGRSISELYKHLGGK